MAIEAESNTGMLAPGGSQAWPMPWQTWQSLCGWPLAFRSLPGVALRFVIGAGLVLVAVVAQVLGRLAFFVQAIGACRSPGHLERKHEQQQEQEEFFHGCAPLYRIYLRLGAPCLQLLADCLALVDLRLGVFLFAFAAVLEVLRFARAHQGFGFLERLGKACGMSAAPA